MIHDEIKAFINEHIDTDYQAFQAKLIPNIDSRSINGVRTPVLKAYAKELSKDEHVDAFLSSLPHESFEENQLHAFILSGMKDYDLLIQYIDAFLPYVNNWATCDQLSPKVFKKHHLSLIQKVDEWLDSSDVYAIRFGIKTLMNEFLDQDFDPLYLEKVKNIDHEYYYVKMMVAWYFATALAKQYDCTIEYFKTPQLPLWTHNKAIQKAIESRRVTDDHKAYLRTLKLKESTHG